MNKLSVIINTLNEEANIEKALKSVRDLASEIIVVDMHSIDRTVSIAKKFGAKVFFHDPAGYVEPARNFGIQKVTNGWVLILDADEEIGEKLKSEIKRVIEENNVDYCRIPRKNIIFGKWIKHTLWWPDFQIRLFKKGKVTWNEIIHSVPITTGKGMDFKMEEDFAIVHRNYDSIEQYLERLNRYTSIQANSLKKDGYKFYWGDIFQKPLTEFVNRYLKGEGYKDGLHGLALSLLQAFSELVIYLKVWQTEKFDQKEIKLDAVVDEIKSRKKELCYWLSDAKFREGGKLIDRIKRRFRI